jgi:hypothetical protein
VGHIGGRHQVHGMRERGVALRAVRKTLGEESMVGWWLMVVVWRVVVCVGGG